ncbi:MAG TPA: hypothetical protein VK203_25745 [Nostocaceae cyanobacterium]|nr:hypothetical protein [Nostocaceae cyanobacterium]
MQPDLVGLEISKGELRRLTGFDPENVYRASIWEDRDKRKEFLRNEGLMALMLTLPLVGAIYTSIIVPTIGSSISLGILLLIIAPVVMLVVRSLWRRFTYPRALTILLDQVDKYHAVVQAIDIRDEGDNNGNSHTNIQDREKVVAALQFIREDLVRALKIARILRDNKKSLADNPELLTNNLASMQSIQVSSPASEYARFLNQSLQIALDVQAEMQKLQK